MKEYTKKDRNPSLQITVNAHHEHNFYSCLFLSEYDENDPSWFITSPGANVLHGRYESAKPFVEKIQRQQRAFLEEKLEERRELRQAIRERVSHDFDEKLKQHMTKFQPKVYSSISMRSHEMIIGLVFRYRPMCES